MLDDSNNLFMTYKQQKIRKKEKNEHRSKMNRSKGNSKKNKGSNNGLDK